MVFPLKREKHPISWTVPLRHVWEKSSQNLFSHTSRGLSQMILFGKLPKQSRLQELSADRIRTDCFFWVACLENELCELCVWMASKSSDTLKKYWNSLWCSGNTNMTLIQAIPVTSRPPAAPPHILEAATNEVQDWFIEVRLQGLHMFPGMLDYEIKPSSQRSHDWGFQPWCGLT